MPETRRERGLLVAVDHRVPVLGGSLSPRGVAVAAAQDAAEQQGRHAAGRRPMSFSIWVIWPIFSSSVISRQQRADALVKGQVRCRATASMWPPDRLRRSGRPEVATRRWSGWRAALWRRTTRRSNDVDASRIVVLRGMRRSTTMPLDPESAALPVCSLVTIGRRTGLPREVGVRFAADVPRDRIYLLAGGRDDAHWVPQHPARPDCPGAHRRALVLGARDGHHGWPGRARRAATRGRQVRLLAPRDRADRLGTNSLPIAIDIWQPNPRLDLRGSASRRPR